MSRIDIFTMFWGSTNIKVFPKKFLDILESLGAIFVKKSVKKIFMRFGPPNFESWGGQIGTSGGGPKWAWPPQLGPPNLAPPVVNTMGGREG